MAIWGGEIMGSGCRSMTGTAAGMLSFQRKFRIFTDNKHIEQYTIFEWLQNPTQNLYLGLQYQTNYASCPYSYLAAITIDEESEDGLQWIATANYEPYNIAVLGQINPLKAYTQASLSFENRTEAVPAVFVFDEFGNPTQDQDGNPIIKQCVNSAGQHFTNPVTKDVGEPVLRITRNEPFVNTQLIDQMIDTTNLYGAGSPSLDPLSWLQNWRPKTLRYMNMEVSWNMHPIIGIYYTCQYIFKVNFRTWVKQIQDEGTRSIDPVTGQLVLNYPVSASVGIGALSDPQLLDGQGHQMRPDPVTNILPPPIFLPFETYTPVDFDIFQFVFAPFGIQPFPPWYRG